MSAPSIATPHARLLHRLGERGELTFAEVMEEALYGEGGYYNRSQIPIDARGDGAGGDFVTGSSLSALFGRATVRLLERLDEVLGQPAALLDAGCGDARHLAAVAEASPGRRLYAWDRILRPLPTGVTRLDSIATRTPVSSRAEVNAATRPPSSSRAEVSGALAIVG